MYAFYRNIPGRTISVDFSESIQAYFAQPEKSIRDCLADFRSDYRLQFEGNVLHTGSNFRSAPLESIQIQDLSMMTGEIPEIFMESVYQMINQIDPSQVREDQKSEILIIFNPVESEETIEMSYLQIQIDRRPIRKRCFIWWSYSSSTAFIDLEYTHRKHYHKIK